VRGARASMCECQRPATPCGIQIHLAGPEGFHSDADFDVSQLANEIVMPLQGPLSPSQEYIAGRLHQPVAIYDPLARIGEYTSTCVGLEHRTTSFFNLQKQRITFACHEQHDPAPCSHATHP